MIVSEILSDAAALLNDPSKLTWTDTVLFPYYKKAHKEIVLAFENHNAPILKETSAIVPVIIGSTSITTLTDIRTPLELWERAMSSTETFQEMIESDWEPEAEPTDTLNFWTWRESTVKFLGATTDREVKIKYVKTLEAPSSANSTVTVPEADLFLAARTAALAAALGGGNFERAAALAQDAEDIKFGLLNNQMQGLQGVPIRKRGYMK